MSDTLTISTLEKDARLFENTIGWDTMVLGFISGATLTIDRNSELYQEAITFYKKAVEKKREMILKLKNA